MKKTWIILGIIMLLFTTFQIISSFAKYSTNATATMQKNAGAWVIKVNNQNITSSSGAVQNFVIGDLVYPENQYVVENKLAPASSGYFDIVIDPTGTSVAIRFDVTLDIQNLDEYDSIGFTDAFRVIEGEEDSEGLVRTGINTYSGIIDLDDIEDEIESTIRFYIGWEEEETQSGDESDTQIGLTPGVSTDLPVTVVVTQYLGEQLIPYQVSTS